MNDYVDKTINLAFSTDPLSDHEKQFVIDGYSEENKNELIRVATKKKVLPVVGKMLSILDVDSDFWKSHYNFFLNRNIEVTNLVGDIFDLFRERNITKICAFENYGALLASGTDLALYSSGDVDLYADVSQKSDIIKAMAEFEYYPTKDFSNSQNIMTEFLKKDGIIRINVAWKPLRRKKLPFKADTSKYFVWDEMSYYKTTSIRLPSKEALLYLCFLRIAVHGYSRSPDIRLYIDTYNASVHNPNWKTVDNWAIQDGVETKFLAVAAIANGLIRLEIPSFLLEKAKSNKHVQRILDIAYDKANCTLKYDPAGIKLLKLEAASDDRTLLGEIIAMIFPSLSFVKEYYGGDGANVARAILRYYQQLL